MVSWKNGILKNRQPGVRLEGIEEQVSDITVQICDYPRHQMIDDNHKVQLAS